MMGTTVAANLFDAVATGGGGAVFIAACFAAIFLAPMAFIAMALINWLSIFVGDSPTLH